MWSLPMIVGCKCLCHLAHLIYGLRPLSLQALLIERAVIAFDKAVLLRVTRIAKEYPDSQSMTKANKGSGKITALPGLPPSAYRDQE